MYIYLIMLMISLIFAYGFRKNKKISLIFAFLPFFIVSALRYDVGTDYMYRYVPDYLKMVNGNDVESLEFVFKLFYKICIYFFNDNYQVVFIITSFIINYLIFWVIYKYSDNIYLSIVLYFISGYYFQSLNIVRQYIDIAILLAGYRLVLDKKYIKWILLCVFATFIHTSALILIPLILLNKIKEIDIKILLGFVIIYILLNSQIKNLVIQIISMTRFSGYFGSVYDKSDVSLTYLVYNSIIYIFMWYSYRLKVSNNEVTEEDKLFFNIQATTILVACLGSIILLFQRMIFYFQICQLLSIPRFIKSFKLKENRKLCTLFIILIFSLLIIRSNVLNNYNEVVPYKTIIQKEELF